MALFKIIKGNESFLPANKTEGYAYFCQDTGAFYIDVSSSERVQVTSRNLINYNNGSRETKSFADLATTSDINEIKTSLITLNVPASIWNNQQTTFIWQDSALNTLRCTLPPLILCDVSNSDTNKALFQHIQSITIDPATGGNNGKITIVLDSSLVSKDTTNNFVLNVIDFG